MAYSKGRSQMSEMADDDFQMADSRPARNSGGKVVKVIIIIILLAIIVCGGYLLVTKAKGMVWSGGASIASVSNDWQAIFLSNGQVYFGKVNAVSEKTVVLANIYYLQVVNKPLQTTAVGGANQAQTQQELTLIKLGNELHGPTDRMVINRDQILLTEKLKNDSRVVEAINNYLKDQQKAQ